MLRFLFTLYRIFTPRRREVTIYNAYDVLERGSNYLGLMSTKITDANPVTGALRTRWVPARPLGPSWDQWKAVWLVVTGRADVLHWPKQER